VYSPSASCLLYALVSIGAVAAYTHINLREKRIGSGLLAPSPRGTGGGSGSSGGSDQGEGGPPSHGGHGGFECGAGGGTSSAPCAEVLRVPDTGLSKEATIKVSPVPATGAP
jgi:hypothetical protein